MTGRSAGTTRGGIDSYGKLIANDRGSGSLDRLFVDEGESEAGFGHDDAVDTGDAVASPGGLAEFLERAFDFQPVAGDDRFAELGFLDTE